MPRQVAALYDALTDVIEPAAIGPWFVTPNEALADLKPLETIERGEIDRLWDMAYRLRSGMPGRPLALSDPLGGDCAAPSKLALATGRRVRLARQFRVATG